MIKAIIYILFFLCVFSCEKTNGGRALNIEKVYKGSDSIFVKNSSYKKGDVRRYGVFPNREVNYKYLENILDLAEKGQKMYFPKGIYPLNLVIKGRKSIKFYFENAIISGAVQILNDSINKSENISLNGRLTILDKLFIRESNKVFFDTILVKSDTINNLLKKRNRGVSIYAGSKNVSFNKLSINNTGGTEDAFFLLSAAALQIHGYNNNPKNIKIKDLSINNSDRTALYLTGDNHKFDKVTITNFGLGSSKNMFGLEDAVPGTEKEFSGAWLSKCNNVVIDSLEINQTVHKGVNSIRLDEGKYHEPTFINHIKITGFAKELNIADHKLTNILVKDEYE